MLRGTKALINKQIYGTNFPYFVFVYSLCRSLCSSLNTKRIPLNLSRAKQAEVKFNVKFEKNCKQIKYNKKKNNFNHFT